MEATREVARRAAKMGHPNDRTKGRAGGLQRWIQRPDSSQVGEERQGLEKPHRDARVHGELGTRRQGCRGCRHSCARREGGGAGAGAEATEDLEDLDATRRTARSHVTTAREKRAVYRHVPAFRYPTSAARGAGREVHSTIRHTIAVARTLGKKITQLGTIRPTWREPYEVALPFPRGAPKREVARVKRTRRRPSIAAQARPSLTRARHSPPRSASGQAAAHALAFEPPVVFINWSKRLLKRTFGKNA